MHHLPPIDSPLRDTFEISDLVAIHTGSFIPETLQSAKCAARKTFEGFSHVIKRTYHIIIKANDDIALISIGSRGGVKHEWNFSTGK